MKKTFTISQWRKTEEGFEEIEPITFEFGVCKYNGSLHYIVNGKVCMKLILGTLFSDNIKDMLLYAYKGVLNGERTEEGEYLFLDDIRELAGNFYTDMIYKLILVDKKITKRDKITEIFEL